MVAERTARRWSHDSRHRSATSRCFRELQKLLSSGDGPINFEIARQIAVAVATQRVPPAHPGGCCGDQAFADAVHEAETLISGYTRLPLDEPMRPDAIGRTPMDLHHDGWMALVARATRNEVHRRDGPPGVRGGGGRQSHAAAMGQMGPLLMGMQCGTLIGHLSKEALGRYDFPIPRDDDGRLFFVVPNLDALASGYGFDLEAFTDAGSPRTMSHDIWSSLPCRGRSLLPQPAHRSRRCHRDRRQGLEQRLVELQSRGPEAMQEVSDRTASCRSLQRSDTAERSTG